MSLDKKRSYDGRFYSGVIGCFEQNPSALAKSAERTIEDWNYFAIGWTLTYKYLNGGEIDE